MQKLEPVTVARQSGMTLIELTVVLLVLIGLAGMLLPYVGGFAQRTHDSANTSSEAELASALGRYESQYMEYPSGMDSLTTAAGVGINYTIAGRMGKTLAAAYGLAPISIAGAAGTRNGIICGSLRKAGFSNFRAMDQAVDPAATPVVGTIANFNPTFNYYVTGAGSTVTVPAAGACTGSLLEALDDGVLANTLGVSIEQIQAKRALGHTFIAVGMGTASEAIGRTIQDAPVHFAARGDVNAANAYNRLIVFFEVDGNGAAGASGCTESNCSGSNSVGTSTSSGDAVALGRTMPTAHAAKLAGTGMAMHQMLGKGYSLGSFYGNMQQ